MGSSYGKEWNLSVGSSTFVHHRRRRRPLQCDLTFFRHVIGRIPSSKIRLGLRAEIDKTSLSATLRDAFCDSRTSTCTSFTLPPFLFQAYALRILLLQGAQLSNIGSSSSRTTLSTLQNCLEYTNAFPGTKPVKTTQMRFTQAKGSPFGFDLMDAKLQSYY